MTDGDVRTGAPAGRLDAAGVRPRKSLGQNFLSDPNVIARIVAEIGDDARGQVLEIGPGLGALTLPLGRLARRLTAVEVDRRLADELRQSVTHAAIPVDVVEGDILEFDLPAAAARAGERLVVVGSIPYNITAPILKWLVDARADVRAAYLVTQREVADKLLMSPGKEGTALGVLVRAYGEIEILRRIPRGAFYPVPDVDSTLWKLTLLERPRFEARPEAFFAVVRAIYGARRKTLRNALQRAFPPATVDAMLAAATIDPRVRGETLGFAELDRLAGAVPLPRGGPGEGDDRCLAQRTSGVSRDER